jgi:hypothetical protein
MSPSAPASRRTCRRIFYKGFSSHAPERMRRELVVFNAR